MSSQFLRQCRPALGTLVEIALWEAQLPAAAGERQRIFDAAFSVVDEVQRQMSFHDAGSDLSRINLARPGTTLGLPAGLYEVLALARQLFDATGGLFDCGVADRLIGAGLLPDHGYAAGDVVEPQQLRSSIVNLQLHEADQAVTITGKLCLDLGGIAKGFAVDQAVEVIAAHGVSCCVVNAGGDLRTSGELAQNIFVRDPGAPGSSILLGQLVDGAVATSAPYFSTVTKGADAYCALFDPCGPSLTLPRSYTVLAERCVIADALTKAVAAAFSRNAGALTQALAASSGSPQAFQADFLDALDARAFIL